MNNCGNCIYARRNGNGTMRYCTFYGIVIRQSYSGCGIHKPRIVEVESEADRNRSGDPVRTTDS